MDNETWLIEAGDEVIEKRAEGHALGDMDELIHCLWVADYCMRNAGDLGNADELRPNLFSDAEALAERLRLPRCAALFAKPRKQFEAFFFVAFESVCDELRGV